MTLATIEPFNWNSLVQLVTAVIVAWTAWRVERRVKAAKEERETLDTVAKGMIEVKAQTNGINRALVEAKQVIAKAEGKVEERAEVAERVQVAQAIEDKAASQRITLPPGAA